MKSKVKIDFNGCVGRLASFAMVSMLSLSCEKNASVDSISEITGATVQELPSKVVVSPAALDFGNQTIGIPTNSRSLTISSTGDEPVVITAISFADSVFTSDDTSSIDGKNCKNTTLEKGQSCTVNVFFIPTTELQVDSAVTIHVTSSGGEELVSAKLSGRGVAGSSNLLVFDPTFKSFGSLISGFSGVAHTFVLLNQSSKDLFIGSFLVSGTGFSLSGNECPSGSTPLKPNETCQVSVTYAPTVAGESSGELKALFSSEQGVMSYKTTSTITGIGLDQDLVGISSIHTAPTSWDFGIVNIGAQSTIKDIEVSNGSYAPIYFGGFDTNLPDFTIVSTTCPTGSTPLPISTSCNVSVKFSPSTGGLRTGVMRAFFGLQNGGSSYMVPTSISGTGRSLLTFSGVSGHDQLTGNSVRLKWTAAIGSPVHYVIHQIDNSGQATFLGQISVPIPNENLSGGDIVYTVSGLSVSTTYKFRVRAVDEYNASDGNNTIDTVTTPSNAPPTISSISPTAVLVGSSGSLTINGINFQSGAVVKVGNATCGSPVVNGAGTQIACSLPANSAGRYDVLVTNPDAQSNTLSSSFSYDLPFSGITTITAITGTTMTLNWGTSVAATIYQIYEINPSNVAVYKATALAPATSYQVTGLSVGTTYKWRVRAVDSNGVQDSNTVDVTAATLLSSPPTISSVSPTFGPVMGANTITINGSNFLASPTVSIGGSTCSSPVRVSSTQVTCIVPGRASGGTFDIVLTNTDTQTTTYSSSYTYKIAFSGLQSVSSATSGTSLTLNWSPSTDSINNYLIYSIDGSGNPTLIGTLSDVSASSYTATGLSPNTAYKFRVRASNSAGINDGNTNDVIASTLEYLAPTLTSISPSSLNSIGGDTITVSGTGFRSGVTVAIGGTPCTSVSVLSATTMTCVSPQKNTGTYDVVVTNIDEQSGSLLSGYTSIAPVVSSITPSTGSSVGNTVVTISGSGFASGATVAIGGVLCSAVNVSSPTSLSCTTGSLTAGTYDVVVRNTDNQPGIFSNGFRYTLFEGLSSIDQISGTSLRLNWTATADGATYQIYSVASGVATYVTSVTSTGNGTAMTYSVTGLSTGTAYTYRVRATNSSGTQDANIVDRTATTLANLPPTLTSIFPAAGPLAGGNTITLTGTDFRTGASIAVGGQSCTSATYVSATSYTCVLSAKSASINSVIITNSDAQYSTLSNSYTYQAAPIASSVNPNFGTYLGSTDIIIAGTGFASNASALLGTTFTVTNATSNSTTEITLGSAPATTLTVGLGVVGFGIPAGTYISSLASQTSFTLSAASTKSIASSLSLTFGVRCENPLVTSSTSMSCTTAPFTTNTVRTKVAVKVINEDMQSGSVSDAYTYTVDSLSLIAGSALNVGCADSSTPATMRFGGPVTGLYSDATHLYIADSVGNMIRRVDYATRNLTLIGGKRCIAGQVDGIFGTATVGTVYGMVKVGNYLYFVEQANHRIRRLDVSGTASQGTILTIAGTGSAVTFVDNTVGLSATFSSPRGITADPSGDYLYVADTGNHLIRRIDLTSGTHDVTTFAGISRTPGSVNGNALTTATFNSPRDIKPYVDGSTTYFIVSDGGTHILRSITVSSPGVANTVSTIVGIAGTAGGLDGNGAAATLSTPLNLSISGTNLFVTSSGGHTVRKVDLTGYSTFATSTIGGYHASAEWLDGQSYYTVLTGTRTISTANITGLSSTTGLRPGMTITGTGIPANTTIASVVNSTSITMSANATASGTTALTIGSVSRIQSPLGVAASGSDVYFTDSSATIRKIDSNQVITTWAGTNVQYKHLTRADNANTTPGVTDQNTYVRFAKERYGDIATDGTNIYVADYSNNCIRKIVAATGWTTTVSGLNTVTTGICTAGGTDGASTTTAKHYAPAGLAYESSTQSLYVSDYSGHTIRKVNLATNQTTTIAGLYNTTGSTDDAVGTNARFNGPMSMAIDTSGATHYLYVGEWTAGNRIRKITLDGTNYPVTTIVGNGTSASVDGYGTRAQTSGVGDLEYASYTIGSTTYNKLFFYGANGSAIRAYDIDTTFVETLTSTTAGYQDTSEPSSGSTDTQSAKMNSPKGLYWDGTHLLIGDWNYSLLRRFDPRTGTLGTFMGTYSAQNRTFTSTSVYGAILPYFDYTTSGKISDGTGMVANPSGIDFIPGFGYVVANSLGIWKLN